MIEQSRLEAIKWAALAAMVVDHVGYAFYPGQEEFRYVGRLALPGFLWVMAHRCAVPGKAEGLFRWLVPWALLGEVAHVALVGYGHSLNILVTLAGATAGVALMDGVPRTVERLLYGAAFIGSMAYAEYSLAPAFFVLLVDQVRARPALVPPSLVLVVAVAAVNAPYVDWMVAAAAGAALIVLWPRKARIDVRLPRWTFYAFYPAHQFVLVAGLAVIGSLPG